jgi:Ni/Co efflux regulator RcnB
MKHLLSVIALALALVMSSSALARDGDGRRFERSQSSRNDYRGHRGDRHFDRKWQNGDRKYYGDRKFGDRRFGDRRFYSDRKFGDRRFYRDRKFYGDRKFFNDRRFDDRRFYRDRRFDDRKFFNDRSYYRSFRRGDRLPTVFLSTRFVVNDFGSHRLYRPPRGYRWVRVERDAFLVGVATGVILTVATDRFF